MASGRHRGMKRKLYYDGEDDGDDEDYEIQDYKRPTMTNAKCQKVYRARLKEKPDNGREESRIKYVIHILTSSHGSETYTTSLKTMPESELEENVVESEQLWMTGLVLVTISLLVLLYRSCKINGRKDPEELKTYTACSSPDCVRCTKYKIICLNASKTIHEFQMEEHQGIERLVEAMKVDSKFQYQSQKPNVLYVPNLRATPYWNKSSFEHDVKILENNWRKIYDDLYNVYYEDTPSQTGWTANITQQGSWHTYYFYNQGKEIKENCLKCPQTYAIIQKLNDFMAGCVFGNALFSVLDSGSWITEHYGPTNIRLRCHLGLNIPQDCALSINKKPRYWHEGKCTIFDDSFIHSANHSGKSDSNPRAVLILDFWHPDLTQIERNIIVSAFGSDMLTNDIHQM